MIDQQQSIEKKRPEASCGRGDGHDPDGGAHRRRHERRHSGREHGREERRERPHRGSDLGSIPAPAAALLELTEAEEEQPQRDVGGEHEPHGGRVGAPGLVDGQRRVEGQGAQAYLCQGGVSSVGHVKSNDVPRAETGTKTAQEFIYRGRYKRLRVEFGLWTRHGLNDMTKLGTASTTHTHEKKKNKKKSKFSTRGPRAVY